MMHLQRIPIQAAPWVFALVLAMAGCGDKGKQAEEEPPEKGPMPIQVIGKSYLPSVGRVNPSNDLSQFYLLYQQYLLDGRPLTKLEDLKAMNLDREAPKIYKAFMEGLYIFNFNAGTHLRPDV